MPHPSSYSSGVGKVFVLLNIFRDKSLKNHPPQNIMVKKNMWCLPPENYVTLLCSEGKPRINLWSQDSLSSRRFFRNCCSFVLMYFTCNVSFTIILNHFFSVRTDFNSPPFHLSPIMEIILIVSLFRHTFSRTS